MRKFLLSKRTILVSLFFFAFITQATYYNLGAFWKSSSSSGQWAWMGGDGPWKPNWTSIFGTQGVADPANRPSGRTEAFIWNDGAGHIWMYGGNGYDSTGNSITALADLWKYDVATNNWTWVSGSGAAGVNAVYGTLGAGSVANTPGSRTGGMSWMDISGNYLWMFGGRSDGSPGGPMSDTWRYEIATGKWTWIAGPDGGYQDAEYGPKGVAGASYNPGSRDRGATAVDSAGNFWLFGGFAHRGTRYYFNDLWKFNPSIGQWAWMGGGDGATEASVQNQNGVYGTKGVAHANNWPGSRATSMWIDSSDDIWFFGGFGQDDGTSPDWIGMNDIWKYNHTTGEWTWVHGSSVGGASRVQGLRDVPAAGNTPGGVSKYASWIDDDGLLWTFGGDHAYNYDATGNDLWQYDPSINQWAWKGGTFADYDYGAWGAQGVASAAYIPAAKNFANAIKGSDGKFYLFGGIGEDSNGTWGYMDDLWSFEKSTAKWTWLKGHTSFPDYRGTYGTIGVANASNWPGIRQEGALLIDNSNQLWIFGGYYGLEWNARASSAMNSIMKYDQTTGQWTWVGGDKALCGLPTYGVMGTPSASNIPPALGAFGYTRDNTGNFWFFGGYGDCDTWDNPVQLWKFNPSTSQWTLMSGFTDTNYRYGNYGTIQTPSTANYPGSRTHPAMTTDASGNIWLFGGEGYDFNGNYGRFNDLWRFNPTTSEWTWMGGAQIVNQNGDYGIKGTESSFNEPGGRSSASFWMGANGMLYLFGGNGFDAINVYQDELNDVWRYNTTTKYWTWMNGSDTTASGAGNAPSYGTLRSFSPSNTPGGKGELARGFQRGTGLFWTVGGYGPINSYDYDQGELWAYDPNGNQWACMSNCDLNSAPVYNTKGAAAPTSTPGNRLGAGVDIDSNLNIWMYGGYSRVWDPMPFGDLWRYK